MEMLKGKVKEREAVSPVVIQKPAQPLKITFNEWFEVLQGFVKAGNCLIDDTYGVHRINRVSLADNSKGKPTGIIFKSER